MKANYQIIIRRDDGDVQEDRVVKVTFAKDIPGKIQEAHGIDGVEEIAKYIGNEVINTVTTWEKE